MSETWPPNEIRAWIDRNFGGNASAAARRLRVHYTQLHRWVKGERNLPPYIQAHMETIDEAGASS